MIKLTLTFLTGLVAALAYASPSRLLNSERSNSLARPRVQQ